MPIVIVDYDMGNLGSIANMLKKINGKSRITADIDEIEAAEKLILPGVGAFDAGMRNLRERNLLSVLHHKVIQRKTPVLGICLGMQLMTRRSAEGQLPGLGWIEAETVKFQSGRGDEKFRIPHMGWNTITLKKTHPIVDNLSSQSRFYFVHSYYVKCIHQQDILTETHYGRGEFTSAFHHENVLGVQFHPEKSHKFGMQLLKNFLELSSATQ